MTAVWVSIGIVAIVNFAIKASGPVLLAGRELPARMLQVIALLAAAILAALVVVGTLSEDGRLKVDEQSAGVAVAGVALLLRVPMLLAIFGGALTAAVLRAVA
jgi:branched-subunit amino acid transport protein